MNPIITEKLTKLTDLMERVRAQNLTARNELLRVEGILQAQNLSFCAYNVTTSGTHNYILVFTALQGADKKCFYLRPRNGDEKDAILVPDMTGTQLAVAMELLPEVLDKLFEFHSRLEVK